MNKILLRYDSRDKIYSQKFGQVNIDLPLEYNADRPLFDDVQSLGSVECVAYTVCDIAEDQDGIEYDINDLWKRVPKNQFGSDPRDVLKEVVTNGLLPKGGTERVKNWKSFWRADVGYKTPYENVLSAIYLAKSPILMATYWYKEWLDVPHMGIMPIGVTLLNGHAYSNEGWVVSKVSVLNERMFLIEPWVGRKMLMPKEVFNKAMKPYGVQTWVLSTSEIDARREKTIVETVKDALINIYIKLIELLTQEKDVLESPKPPVVESKPVEPVEVLKPDYLTPFCNAIAQYEGGPGDLNHRNNNPGNLRSVKGPFLKFKTWEDGMNALRDYVTRAATGKHKAYKPEFTITQFFKTYAPSSDNNQPDIYASWVANKVGISINFKIKDLV